MAHFITAHLFEAVGCGWIAAGFGLFREFTIHRVDLVRLAFDRISQIVGIAAHESSKGGFFCEMLEALHLGRLFEQASQFRVTMLLGLLGVQQVFSVRKSLAVHGNREVFLGSRADIRLFLGARQVEAENAYYNGDK